MKARGRTGAAVGGGAPRGPRDMDAVERRAWGAINELRALTTMGFELRAAGHLEAAAEVIAACNSLAAAAEILVKLVLARLPAAAAVGVR